MSDIKKLVDCLNNYKLVKYATLEYTMHSEADLCLRFTGKEDELIIDIIKAIIRELVPEEHVGVTITNTRAGF